MLMLTVHSQQKRPYHILELDGIIATTSLNLHLIHSLILFPIPKIYQFFQAITAVMNLGDERGHLLNVNSCSLVLPMSHLLA